MENTEGYDRILQRILIDGRGFLMGPLTELFKWKDLFLKV